MRNRRRVRPAVTTITSSVPADSLIDIADQLMHEASANNEYALNVQKFSDEIRAAVEDGAASKSAQERIADYIEQALDCAVFDDPGHTVHDLYRLVRELREGPLFR